MLDFLRRQAKSPVIQVFIVIIILVFIFWGPDLGGNDSRTAVATVNGEAIDIAQYSREYSRMVDDLRDQFGGNLPKNLIETLGIKEQVLQRLIQQTLLIQGAQRMGLLVSTWEIQEEIINQPYFQVAGIFDNDRYRQLLAQNKMTPKQYEESLRQELLTRKVSQQLGYFAGLTEWEIDQRFAFDNNEIQLAYYRLQASDFSQAVTITEEELADYFNEHKEAYRSAPQVKLQYLAFPVARTMETMTIPTAEIEAAYQAKISDYQQPEQRRVRHILLKTDGSNDTAQESRARDILAQIKEGGDFGALARQHSEDAGSAAQGGELGTFSRGQMVAAFDDAVFSLAVGELSAPVKTRFGFHIIEVQDIIPARITTLAEVKDVLERTLKQEQAREKAFEAAGMAYEKIFQAGSLTAYSQEENIDLLATDFFSPAAPPTQLAGLPRLLDQAFSLTRGDLSSLIEESDGYYIVYIEEVREPEIPDLADIKEAVSGDFLAARSRELTQDKAREILAAGRDGADFQEVVSAAGGKVQISPWFSRMNRSRSNLPDTISSQGLTLSDSKPYPENIAVDATSAYVFRFHGKQASQSATPEDREAFITALRQEKQLTTLENWLNHMTATGHITTNPKLIQ